MVSGELRQGAQVAPFLFIPIHNHRGINPSAKTISLIHRLETAALEQCLAVQSTITAWIFVHLCCSVIKHEVSYWCWVAQPHHPPSDSMGNSGADLRSRIDSLRETIT